MNTPTEVTLNGLDEQYFLPLSRSLRIRLMARCSSGTSS